MVDEPKTPATTVNGAVETPPVEAAVKADAPKEPSEKTYTEAEFKRAEEEWKTRYGGLDKKLTETSTQLNEMLKKGETDKWNVFIKDVEAKGGDANFAKGMLALKEELAMKEATLKERGAAIEQFARLQSVLTTIQDLALEDPEGKIKTELLAVEKPEAMKVKALEIKVEQLKIAQKKTTEPDNNKSNAKKSESDMPWIERLGNW
jgi:hypothetical protein